MITKRLIGFSLIKIGDVIEKIQFLFGRTALKLLLVVLGFFLGFGICARMYRSEAAERQKVEEFITNIINSSIIDTSYYKEYSSPGAVNSIQRHAKDFTTFFKINIYDKTFDAYESIVTFSNGMEFYVDVIIYKDDVRLNQWLPNEPNKVAVR